MWALYQDEEQKFNCEEVYSDLLKNFARPQSNSQKVAVFKRKVKKTVVVHDTDKLKGWGKSYEKVLFYLLFRNFERTKNQECKRVQTSID